MAKKKKIKNLFLKKRKFQKKVYPKNLPQRKIYQELTGTLLIPIPATKIK